MAVIQSNFPATSTYIDSGSAVSTSLGTINGIDGTLYTVGIEMTISANYEASLYISWQWRANSSGTYQTQNAYSAYLYDGSNYTKLNTSGTSVYWNTPKSTETLYIFWRKNYNGQSSSTSYNYANNSQFMITVARTNTSINVPRYYIAFSTYTGTATNFPTVTANSSIKLSSLTALKLYLKDQAYILGNRPAIDYCNINDNIEIPAGTKPKLQTTDWTTFVNAHNKFDNANTLPVPGNIIVNDAYFLSFNLS